MLEPLVALFQEALVVFVKLRVILVVAQALCVLTVFVFAAVIAAFVAGLVALYVVLLARLLIEFSGHVLRILKLVEFLANVRAV